MGYGSFTPWPFYPLGKIPRESRSLGGFQVQFWDITKKRKFTTVGKQTPIPWSSRFYQRVAVEAYSSRTELNDKEISKNLLEVDSGQTEILFLHSLG
jgi:hypothetical protein